MNKIIKTAKKEDESFDSSALRRANANIEAYSPEELAHFGVRGMRWGVRNDRSSGGIRSAHQKNLDNKKVELIERAERQAAGGLRPGEKKVTGFRSAHQKALDKKFVESTKKKNEKDEEKSINKAEKKAMSLANKKYLKVYNAMADESTEFYSKISNKPEYKGKKIPFDNNNPLTKKYMAECAKAATESLQRNSDRILGNKVDSRVAVKWSMPGDLGSLPSFYIERVGAEIKQSEDISDDKIKLSVKFNDLRQIEKISLPEGAEDEFISDEDGDDQDENDDEG